MTAASRAARFDTDEDLAEALLAREPGASLVAWRRFRPLVRRILRSRLGFADVVDDVEQDVFANFFRVIPGLRDPRALRPFVVTLAKRTLANELRRRRHRARLRDEVEALQQGALELPADPSSRQAFGQFCWRLSRLNERDRRVLWMCIIEHREAAEAAEALGVSVPTVRRALTRVRRKVASWGQSDPFLCEFASAPSHQGGVT